MVDATDDNGEETFFKFQSIQRELFIIVLQKFKISHNSKHMRKNIKFIVFLIYYMSNLYIKFIYQYNCFIYLRLYRIYLYNEFLILT